MNGIHRNARIAPLVWGGLAALCLVLFMVAREQERAALTERVDAAERRALVYGDTVLHRSLEAGAVSEPLTGATYRDLSAVIQDRVFGDDRLVARVRLWAPDGTLLFSTAANERGKIGRLRVNEDPAITAAAGGTVSSRLATVPVAASTTGDPGTPTDLLETFIPLRVADRTDVLGAVQIDQYYDAIRSAAAGPWRVLQWVCAGLAVLFVALTLLSFRRRSAEQVVASPAQVTAVAPPTRAVEPDRRTEEHESATAALRAEHESATAALRAEHEDAIAALRTTHEDAIAALRAEHEEAVTGLRTELAASMTAAAAFEREASEASASRPSPSSTPSLEAQALELLEARVIAAEERAADAERRLAELGLEGPPPWTGHREPVQNGQHAVVAEPDVPIGDPEDLEPSDGDHGDDDDPDGSPVFPITPEASELRARLARSAALKKRSIEGSSDREQVHGVDLA